MTYSLDDQITALAGVFQAAALVNQLAKQGSVTPSAYESSIKSLFALNPKDTATVFGDRLGVYLGLKELNMALDKGQLGQQMEILRYTLSLLHLESKLRKNRDMLDILGKRIDQAVAQVRHFEPTHSNVIKNLASIYLDTISSLTPRIQVHGDPQFLKAPDNADKIRALLLAGIRSAVLWRQTGGRRWHLIFKRRQLLEQCKRLQQA